MREKLSFADVGDSGAAVYNFCGNWVGVVFGGVPVKQTQQNASAHTTTGAAYHITLITAATDIVDHFKKKTGGGRLEVY